MATKVHKDKLGQVKLTDKQKEIIAQGVETEFWKIISKSLRIQRQTRLAVELVNVMPSVENMHHYRGLSQGWDDVIKQVEKQAKEYNEINLDADTEGVDED